MIREGPGSIEFGGPARYRIVVQGRLDPRWAGRLGGLVLVADGLAARAGWSVLTGRIRDQAELKGIIDTLHGLHLPIRSVEAIAGDDAETT